jgi:hypothetical protein
MVDKDMIRVLVGLPSELENHFEKLIASTMSTIASMFTPVPTCANEGCETRTRAYKNDYTRYTKYCDQCSSNIQMNLFGKRAAAGASYEGPVCSYKSCMKECRRYKNDATKWTKYCDECGHIRKAEWEEYVKRNGGSV